MPNGFDYTELIGFQIIKGEVLVKRRMLAIFMEKGYDLTFEQWTVLNVLYAEPGIIQSEIAARTFKDKTNVTRILDVLAKKGYVAREAHGKDRRSFQIYLTAAGQEMFADLIPHVQQLNEQFKQDIPDEEMAQFIHTLEKICRNAQ
ncbi:MarR family winged helix-turn-helix transcriptional regulator [Paenibacillus jilunlii]|uniref:DNA-binding transcriptional regulator, MarR family n=1 Tax=Paenibacillus jilunlii TaxID=682956 RepID=A0A1G9IX34_9BACL|nr:MarR family transcriptional regulator [Paenibacillus jilunlii]KWX72684.1 MarR family transcriptional regulator [Paenibacillus jilunlii]SDL29404.1 DNA-binding transcriptional regulator, MarR family [Paenibacillus jilunlii]